MNDQSDPVELAATMLKKAVALSELAAFGCYYPELFSLQVTPFLKVTEDGECLVTDDKGSIRYGVTPRKFVEQLRAEYQAEHPNRWFTK